VHAKLSKLALNKLIQLF